MSGLFSSATTPQQQQQPSYTSMPVQTSSYGKSIPIIFGRTRVASNLLWYDGFVAVAHVTEDQTTGGGKGGSPTTTSTTYTYNVDVIFGIGEGPLNSIESVWKASAQTSLAALNMSFTQGFIGQAALPFLVSNFPAAADGYSGIGYAAATPLDLGDSANLDNYNFEVNGLRYATAPNGVDADTSLVISDLLTSDQYGAGFPADALGDLTTYRNFVNASGLWTSLSMEDSTTAASILGDLATFTYSEYVWSQGKLNLVPRGNVALSANGYTYTPPSEPLFDLDDDDFMPIANGSTTGTSSDPVVINCSRPADHENDIKVEYLDRGNQYATAIAEIKDEAAIASDQLRFLGTKTAHFFNDPAAAHVSAQLLMQQQYVRNSYNFSLDQRWIILDPMDIVTLTDARLGLDRQWVRITEITENDDGSLDFVAEEYLGGTGAAAEYTLNVGRGHIPNFNQDPGSINTPIIVEAPVELAATALEIWAAVSGSSPLWGGCDIHISSDGESYSFLGTQTGSARMGFSTNTLPIATDPDEDNTLSVDLSESQTTLGSGTLQDAQQGNTLCLIDNELISYEFAEMMSQYHYNLGTYMRRGLAGTTIANHNPGAPFVRLDDATLVKIPYAANQIGQTVFMKFVSFNIYSGGEQNLADVPAYEHKIIGPPAPGIVQNFEVSQQPGNSSVVFTWSDLDESFALKGYDISYGPVGGTVETSNELTIASRTTEMTNASVPSGVWIFYIQGHDIVDQLGPATQVQFTVVDNNGSVLNQDAAPDWIGATVTTTVTVPITNIVVISSGTTYTIPTSTTTLDLVECIGPGGAGTLGVQGRIGSGGGGGAYAAIANYAVTGGGSIPIQLGIGQKTFFNSATTVCADFGKNATASAGGVGGLAANSVGTITRNGGSGSTQGGGGGAGGASAAGGDASGGNGGRGDGTQGGLGGVALNDNLVTISNQFDNSSLWTITGSAISIANGVGPVELTFGAGLNVLSTAPQFSPASNTTYTVSCQVSGSTSFRFSGFDGNGGLIAPSGDITPTGGRASWSVTTGTLGSGVKSFALISNSAQSAGIYEIAYFKVELGNAMTWDSNQGVPGAEHEGVGSGGGTGAGGDKGIGGLYGGGAGGNAQSSVTFNPASFGGNTLLASNLLSDPAWLLLDNTALSGNTLTFT